MTESFSPCYCIPFETPSQTSHLEWGSGWLTFCNIYSVSHHKILKSTSNPTHLQWWLTQHNPKRSHHEIWSFVTDMFTHVIAKSTVIISLNNALGFHAWEINNCEQYNVIIESRSKEAKETESSGHVPKKELNLFQWDVYFLFPLHDSVVGGLMGNYSKG